MEFIADASEGLRADRIWFMEMNTRLQVEHPVTEMITGLDLVEWQLRVASGEPLPLKQDEIAIDGWAMEARLYAENPATGFLPSIGRLERFRLPKAGVRVDTGVEEGGEVSPFYDPMIAKLIVHADTREAAAAALAQACREVEIWPVRTNAAFLARVAEEPDFVAGRIDTGFIPARLDALAADAPLSQSLLDDLATDLRDDEAHSARGPLDAPALTGFRLNGPAVRETVLWVDGEARRATLKSGSDHAYLVDQLPYRVFEAGAPHLIDLSPPLAAAGGAASDGKLTAPMPGRIVALAVAQGQRVAKGAAVVTLEAMKMEHGLTAPFDAIVAEAAVSVGQQVSEGALLVRLEKAD